MRYFLDTEFNGFDNELISLALVGEDGRSFYAVMDCKNPQPWVAEHVMPFLYNVPDTVSILRPNDRKDLATRLASFMNQDRDEQCVVYADWPDDFRLFYQSFTHGAGMMSNVRSFGTQMLRIDTKLSPIENEYPHNAWWDATVYGETFKLLINSG